MMGAISETCSEKQPNHQKVKCVLYEESIKGSKNALFKYKQSCY